LAAVAAVAAVAAAVVVVFVVVVVAAGVAVVVIDAVIVIIVRRSLVMVGNLGSCLTERENSKRCQNSTGNTDYVDPTDCNDDIQRPKLAGVGVESRLKVLT